MLAMVGRHLMEKKNTYNVFPFHKRMKASSSYSDLEQMIRPLLFEDPVDLAGYNSHSLDLG